MILSDRSIREQIAAGRIVIDPLDLTCIQPSSVDLRLDRYFRVFRNYTLGHIDVKQDLEDLTELVEIGEEDVFMLHPGEFVLGSTAERIHLPEDLVARLEGKALALDTAVPTPRGWTTMGELEMGGEVFDDRGSPCRIVATSEVMIGRRCFEVVFSDGQSVVADAQHQWRTCQKADRVGGRRRTRVVSTAEMAAKLRVRNEWNHHVVLAGPVQYQTKALPIDPYVLGIWLGDGTSTKAEVTCGDPFILEQIRRAGFSVAPTRAPICYRVGGTGHRRDSRSGRYVRNGSLPSLLRELDLFGNKHVPEIYLQASIAQRQALLEGLMDSDGYVDIYGRCEFSNTREALADAVAELAASLGLRPVKSKKAAYLNGVNCGPAYLIKFTPHQPVFRLPRKLCRQRLGGRFHDFRAVVAAREVPSVPVRCIQLEAPSGLYLVSRSFIPTHNSSLGRLGLLIHSTAGVVDCGFEGHLTLELSNVANLPITLYPAMKIGQVSFLTMTSPADVPYGSPKVGSKYQRQKGPTPSRYFENFR